MGNNDEREKTEATVAALKRRGFDARLAENREEARKMALDLIPDGCIVGLGDSATVRGIGLLQDLMDLGHPISGGAARRNYAPRFLKKKTQPAASAAGDKAVDERFEYLGNPARLGCNVFLTSSNAITEDGMIVNIDGGGGRVAGMIVGGELGIIVVGRNKICKDTEEALYRIKNVIAPIHSKKAAIDNGMLCATAGRCVEPEVFCDPKVRACNAIVILEGATALGGRKTVVIIVDEDIGLAFDPAWPQERIDKIIAEYEEFSPPHGLVRA